ncbi:MAG: sulfur carrier protein ThiS [Gemmatimonadota bacterium]|nr:sulfur carrier protein ThiS [Gemmatimonadota bacterium]
MTTSAQGDGEAGATGIGPGRREVSIVLNGQRRVVEGGMSVRALLRQLELEPGMVVVEHNRRILARDALSEAEVEEGDRIELVHFVGGG